MAVTGIKTSRSSWSLFERPFGLEIAETAISLIKPFKRKGGLLIAGGDAILWYQKIHAKKHRIARRGRYLSSSFVLEASTLLGKCCQFLTQIWNHPIDTWHFCCVHEQQFAWKSETATGSCRLKLLPNLQSTDWRFFFGRLCQSVIVVGHFTILGMISTEISMWGAWIAKHQFWNHSTDFWSSLDLLIQIKETDPLILLFTPKKCVLILPLYFLS